MRRQNPEQLGVCSWSLQPRNAAELAEKVEQLGLQRVQLELNGLCTDPAAWGDTQRRLADVGAAIASGTLVTIGEDYSSLESIRVTGGVVPDEHWPGNRQMIERLAAVAGELGLDLVSAHMGFMPEDEADPGFEKLVDRVAWIGRRFGEAGATLLFETGQEDAVTLARFLDAVAARGVANVAVNFDPANMILYGMGEPVAALEALMPRVRQVHLKDACGTETPGTWGREVVVGDGEVQWRAFLEVLARADYRGSLMIEREAGEDRLGDIACAVKRISNVMQEMEEI